MSHSIKVFGIANCDTVRKTRKWFDSQSLSYEFHDYKKLGVDESLKANINEARAIALMAEHTSLIKRPVVQKGKTLILGFDTEQYQSELL